MDVLGTAGPAITKLVNDFDVRLSAIAPPEVLAAWQEFKGDLLQIGQVLTEAQTLETDADKLIKAGIDSLDRLNGMMDSVEQMFKAGITIQPAVKA